MKPKTTKHETSQGIEYPVWDEKSLKAFPITKLHIGTVVRVASDPKNKSFTLLEIKEEGSPGFPNGGYLISDPQYQFPRAIFLDEAIAWPQKPRKRRKRKTK